MKRFLVADIGGTNCRLALCLWDHAHKTITQEITHPTASLTNSMDLAHALMQLSATPDGIAIALAGQIQGSCGRTTNANLVIDTNELQPFFPDIPIRLVNDFDAQAYATLTCPCACIRPGNPLPHAPRGVIGPGTGLGSGQLRWITSSWQPIAAEGGHMPFPFTPHERAIQDFFVHKIGREHISFEDVLAGAGLVLLHAFCTGESLDAKTIGTHFLKKPSQTQSLYARFLGRFCQSWMLASTALGGLWIGGGIAIQNQELFANPSFRAELVPTQRTPWTATIPISCFQTTRVGLIGAATSLTQPSTP